MQAYWDDLLDPWRALWAVPDAAAAARPWFEEADNVLSRQAGSAVLMRVDLLECHVQALRAAQTAEPALALERARSWLSAATLRTTPLGLGVSTVLDASGQLDEALTLLREMQAVATPQTCAARSLHVQVAMGRLLVLKGDELRATQVLLAGIAEASALGARRQEAKMLGNLGFLYGESTTAPFEAYTRRALEIGRELGDARLIAHSLCNLGAALSSQGRLEEAWACLTEGLALARSIGWRHSEALITGGMGGVLARKGDLNAAIAHYQTAADVFGQLGDLYQVARQLLNLAQHLWSAGDLERACEALTKCQAICEGDRFLQLAWPAHELRSRIAEQRGEVATALASLRTAWSIRAALAEARSAERVRLLELHAEAEKSRLEAEQAEGRSRRLEALAYRDTLTGLANRRSLGERLESEVARARRRGRPLLVAMVDVDFFKRINDTMGHGAGDDVLATLGDRLEKALRREDVVGRWGGEEFCVICPETDAAAGEVVLRRLVTAVKTTPMQTRAGAVDVTVSVGATLIRATDHDGNDLLGRADEALYAAKRSGRDRFVLSGVYTPAAVATTAWEPVGGTDRRLDTAAGADVPVRARS